MRRLVLVAAGAASLFLASCGQAEKADAATVADNPRLAALFAEDQAARHDGYVSLTESMADAERQAEVRALLQQGRVRSGADYWRGAFILHHGKTADDVLAAHVMATAALAQGHDQAGWLAAASLDRYLQATGRPQIYGTQFTVGDAVVGRGAFDPDFMPDTVREATGVPRLAEQTAP